MNIFLQTSSTLSESEIFEIFHDLGIIFSTSLIAHYSMFNGGYPAKNVHRWPDGATTEVNHFFSIKHKGFTQFEEVYKDLCLHEHILPENCIPFAVDPGANLFCLIAGLDNSEHVCYANMNNYDADCPSNCLVPVAASLLAFIDNLEMQRP